MNDYVPSLLHVVPDFIFFHNTPPLYSILGGAIAIMTQGPVVFVKLSDLRNVMTVSIASKEIIETPSKGQT